MAAAHGFPEQINRLPPFEGPFDAQRLAAEGCDVLFATYPADAHIADHHHDTDNVGVITSGELRLTIGGVETRYGCGEVVSSPTERGALRQLRSGEHRDRVLVWS